MLRDHPVQVRADLQRYYNLNIDHMGTAFTANHAAACAACLPMGSCTLAAYEPALQWTWVEHKIHELESILARHVLPYPWEAKQGMDEVEFEAVEIDEFVAWYETMHH